MLNIPNKILIKHLTLFLLTILTTYLLGGFWYSFTLMLILLSHESGHFIMSRRYNVPATLPYFIPLPLPPFGTLGAVIKMRGRIGNRRALMDIGAAGPLTGFFFTIPAIVIGLRLSEIVAVKKLQPNVTMLGDSLLFSALQWLVLGDIPAGYDVVLHPVAYAGWVGLFVTALNLLPIGQLDGGHVIYALFGKKSRLVSYCALGFLAFICLAYNPGWLLLLILLTIFGIKHPPLMDEATPLNKMRYFIGIFALLIFIFSFTPIPFPQYVNEMFK